MDIKMAQTKRNHQGEENNSSKRRRLNHNDESSSARYNPYPEWRDRHSYKNRNKKYPNRNWKNHSVNDRYDNRKYHRNQHNFEGKNNYQRRNFNNDHSRTPQQRDDSLQSSYDNRERDFLLGTTEAPIPGPSETKTTDMRSTDASNFKNLLNNEDEIMLTNDEEEFLLDTPEVPILEPSETKTTDMRSTDASSFKDLLIKEEDIIHTDDEDDFLMETSEASVILGPTKTDDIRSSDASNFKDLSSLHQNNEDEIMLPDFEEDLLLDTPEAPGPSGSNEMRSTDVSNFKNLLLKPEMIKSLNAGGYELPSEIQSECIPQALSGHDILAQAKSGTGKTLAFILSTLHLLEAKENEIHTLVICPTRELAHQIGRQYECFSKHLPGIRIATFFGGMPIQFDINQLKNKCPHIVVGTVGRILSLIKSKNLDVQHLKHFVLDECDQMLQLPNTTRQIQEIYLNLPREKQVLMFSATLNQEIRKECKKYMRNPIEIYMDDKEGLRMGGLEQSYVCLQQHSKFEKLVQLLDSLQYAQMVIFVKSVSRCKTLEHLLLKNKYSAIGIHRAMNQQDRLKRYEEVKKGDKRILVATNVFGRGMDVGGINAVINYDMPGDPDTYLHGVARAGRFDTKGIAITFLSDEEDTKILNEVQRKFQVKINKLPN